MEDFTDRGVFFPPFADLIVVYRPPELQRFLYTGGFIISSILGGEAVVPPPEEVQLSV